MIPEMESEEEFDPSVFKADLYQSAKENDTNAVMGFLADRVPPTYIDKSGWTALHWAAKNGNSKLVRSLLDAKASAPYHHVMKQSNKEKSSKEPDNMEDIEPLNLDSLQATFENMQKRREVEEIADYSKDLLKNTPLLWASFKGHMFIVWMLLCDGYSPYNVDEMGNTAIHLAAAAGHGKVVDVLIRDGMNSNIVNMYKNRPVDTTTDPRIRDMLFTSMAKCASMTPKEARERHESNVRWYSGMKKGLSDVIAAIDKSVEQNAEAEEVDEEAYVSECEGQLKDLSDALHTGKEWSIDEDLIDCGDMHVTRLETNLEVYKCIESVRLIMPIRKQSVFIEHVHLLEKILSGAQKKKVDEHIVLIGRKVIAQCKIELWMFEIMARLNGLEIATEAFEHDVTKLGHAIDKAKDMHCDETLVVTASLLHRRLVAELEGSRALLSVPIVRLPLENPPDGYWQESDKGKIVETEGFPLPPEGGEYMWEHALTYSLLQRSIEKIKAILSIVDGSGINPTLVVQLKEKLIKGEKEFKALEVKDGQDKVAAIEAATKLAKKLKKKGGGAKKKKE
jgi:ankyrin repeat protein